MSKLTLEEQYKSYLKSLDESFGTLPEKARIKALRVLEICLSQTLFIGRDLRTLREMRGYSQEQLAEELRSSQAYISRVESGKVPVPQKYLDWLRETQ